MGHGTPRDPTHHAAPRRPAVGARRGPVARMLIAFAVAVNQGPDWKCRGYALPRIEAPLLEPRLVPERGAIGFEVCQIQVTDHLH